MKKFITRNKEKILLNVSKVASIRRANGCYTGGDDQYIEITMIGGLTYIVEGDIDCICW